jgi:hypothetical protein
VSEWRGTFRDRLLRSGRIVMPPWLTEPDAAADLLEPILNDLPHAEVFVADNVAEYLYAVTDQEHWGPGDFPCVAPPFGLFFIEWGRPSRVLSEEYGQVDVTDTVPAHTGWLLTATEREDAPGWHLRGTMFLEFDRRDPMVALLGRETEGIWWPALLLNATLAADGSIEDLGEPGLFYDRTFPPDKVEKLTPTVRALGTMLWPALLTLTFVNCRNVPREQVEPPTKLVRRDAKRKLVPRRGYHLLDIGPMTTTLATEGGVSEHGSVQRALHVCRGHFKTYTADAPLFGHAVGTWWWGPQLRGAEQAGVSAKDYRVHRREVEE